MESSTPNRSSQSQRRNTRSTTRDKSKSKSKSKFQSVNVIRDNQPENYRQNTVPEIDDEYDWQDGNSVPSSSVSRANDNDNGNHTQEGVTVEFDALPESAKKKRIRRATAQDKEVAELVHKVHLLCLLARGRLIDAACDDPLIQAALLSLLPPHLLKISEASKLTAKTLTPFVSWFHRNFHVRSLSSAEMPFHSALASSIERKGGSPEEVAALSVALFRALNLTTRFVSILDASSLKPEVERDEPSSLDISRDKKELFDSSTLMVNKMHQDGADTNTSVSDGKNIHGSAVGMSSETKPRHLARNIDVKESLAGDQLKKSDQLAGETQNTSVEDKPRRKGDLEFELQMEMALSATAAETLKRKPAADMNGSLSSPSTTSSPLKKLKTIAEVSTSSSHVMSTAIGSKKVGAPLYWAEVYCSGENLSGKWVHVDAVNAIVDGELQVEAAAAACKKSLRYVVAFAGHGGKDVTRRYCTKWYKVSPSRINPEWWDTVLSPLKELESRATGGMVPLHQHEMNSSHIVKEGELNLRTQACNSGNSGLSDRLPLNASKDHEKSSLGSSSTVSRTTLEDMELATRALTEPLPTSQQAYRNHSLYAIEKWLTKYQTLHPKGPVLGFCSGHAVYPRTCVQTLHTKQRWLREGLQVKLNELPAKVVKSSFKGRRGQVTEVEDSAEGGSDGVIDLFGKWQTEPLCLPPAVDGIVPKNERGQVDAWSDKCLPPGTIHLRLPRLVPVAKRLGIDFAPAMVGFDFRNGRSVPVYEGIVVCTEFREAILEAYAEEEHKREEEEKKRDERQAISRWYQLLSSIVTRQRLNDSYRDDLQPETVPERVKPKSTSSHEGKATVNESTIPQKENKRKTEIRDSVRAQNHEHVFVTDDEGSDEESMMRTKRCHCGLSIQVEAL